MKNVDYSYNKQTKELDITLNGEKIGSVSGNDVPYLTSRSIYEIWYGRIMDFLSSKGINNFTFPYYIDGHGYMRKNK